MTDTLRERVARVLRAFYSDEPIAVCDGVAYKAADAAIALIRNETLEEAAKRVDDMPCTPAQQEYDYWHGYGAALNYSAAAIRALKDKP